MTGQSRSWIDEFYDYTEKLPSPSLFRRWSAIAAVAGALERKVFLRTGQGAVYPNLYTILCGPPGVGKTEVTWRVEALWQALGSHHVAAKSLTRASLADELADAERSTVSKNGVTTSFNSLLVVANELGVLLPAYENDFMNTLTDLYDGKPYTERKRSRSTNIQVERPQINLLAATTPSYLNNVLPEGAWDQGFLSRTFVIYSGETHLHPLWADLKTDEKEWKRLLKQFTRISTMQGEFEIADDAKEMLNNFQLSRPDHEPNHPKLVSYNTRRTLHLLKLSMIVAAATDLELTLHANHVSVARDWLLEAERYMSDIFKSMAMGGDSNAIKEAWHFTYTKYMKTRKPIPEALLYAYLQERVPAHSVERIIQVMVKSTLLKEEPIPKVGTGYVPKEFKT